MLIKILQLSRKILGKNIFDFLIKHSIYKQYMGGETENDVRILMRNLKNRNIEGIIDYAVESDIVKTDLNQPYL